MAYSIHLKHPFTMMISGPTGSGKTSFVRNMINGVEKICLPPPSKITYFYGEYQQVFISMPNVTFVEGLQEEIISKVGGYEPEWIIIDDLIN
jgi:septin family protein